MVCIVAIYTPGVISEGSSDIKLVLEGDNDTEASNPIKESMDEIFGEGAYENWGPMMFTFSLATMGISEMAQIGINMVGYYFPQINNSINTVNRNNTLMYRYRQV